MEIEWKFKKTITEEEINIFEKERNVTLSDSLKQCVLMNNGGRTMQHMFDTEKEKEKEFKRLLPFNKNIEESVYLFTNLIEDKGIPFAITPSGDLIYEKEKKIYMWEHELNSSYQIADSFNDFLEKLY